MTRDEAARAFAEKKGWSYSTHDITANRAFFDRPDKFASIEIPAPAAPLHEHLAFVGRVAVDREVRSAERRGRGGNVSEPRMEYQARFWRPGAFFGEDWDKPIESADPKAVEWPDNAYCFDLYERKAIDGPDGAKYHTDWKKIGKRYYHPDSKVLTLDDVKARPEFCRPTSFLATNMEGNGWESIVLSRWGNWPQEFDPATDEILPK